MRDEGRNLSAVPAAGEAPAGVAVHCASWSFSGQRHEVNDLSQPFVDNSTFWHAGRDLAVSVASK